jgi:hypothetical protein
MKTLQHDSLGTPVWVFHAVHSGELGRVRITGPGDRLSLEMHEVFLIDGTRWRCVYQSADDTIIEVVAATTA